MIKNLLKKGKFSLKGRPIWLKCMLAGVVLFINALIVLAATSNILSFDNGYEIESINLTANQNTSRYLTMPNYVYINNATLNLNTPSLDLFIWFTFDYNKTNLTSLYALDFASITSTYEHGQTLATQATDTNSYGNNFTAKRETTLIGATKHPLESSTNLYIFSAGNVLLSNTSFISSKTVIDLDLEEGIKYFYVCGNAEAINGQSTTNRYIVGAFPYDLTVIDITGGLVYAGTPIDNGNLFCLTEFVFSDGTNATLNGYENNLVNLTNGVYNTSLSFDGVNDYVNITRLESVNVTDEISFGAWLNSTSDNSQVALSKRNSWGVNGVPYELRYESDNISCSVYGNELYYAESVGIDRKDEWHNILCVLNSTSMALYIDGVRTDINTYSSTNTPTNELNTIIGKDIGGSSFFNGTIDDLVLFNTSLSQQQITYLFEHQTDKYYPSNTTVYVNDEVGFIYGGDITGNVKASLNITKINNILGVEDCCNISIINDKDSYTELSIFNLSYEYGVEECQPSKWNHTVLNISYFDESTSVKLAASNNYILYISNPFTQTLSNTITAQTNHTFCSNVNLTDKGLTYEMYGSMNLAADNYETKIIENNIITPYVVETQPYYYLPIYLVDIGNASQVEFTLKDSVTINVMSDVQVKMYQYINAIPVLINQKLTDVTGKVVFDYISDKQYLINFSKIGYTSLSSNFNPITSSTYDVYLVPTTIVNETEPFARVSVFYNPKVFYKGDNNFSITFYNPYGEFNSFSYTLDYPGGSTTDSGTTIYGKTFKTTFTIVNPAQFDTVLVTVNYNTDLTGDQTFTYSHEIITAAGNYTMMKNKDKTYGLGLFERLLVAVFIVILVAGIATLMGQMIAGLFLGFITYGYLVFIGFIPLWSILLSIFAAIIIVSGRSD